MRFGDVFEGFLPVRYLGGDYYEYDDRVLALVGRSTGRSVRLGDPAAVVVREIDRARGRVTLAPPSPAAR